VFDLEFFGVALAAHESPTFDLVTFFDIIKYYKFSKEQTLNASSACPRGFNIAATVSSLLLIIILPLLAWLDPDTFVSLIATDDSATGAGLLEDLTVLVLIPGILCGLYAFYRYRGRLPHPVIGFWVLAWSLASIYFAGEEASWGNGCGGGKRLISSKVSMTRERRLCTT